MSSEICLSKEARKVWGEEQDVHDTGSVFQSAMHEGKKDRSLLSVLHTAWWKVFFRSVCVARSKTRGGSLDCREGGPSSLTTFRKTVACIDVVSTPMLAIRFPLERTRLASCDDLHVRLLLQPKAGVFQLAGSLPGCRNPRRVRRTPVPAELDFCRDALPKYMLKRLAYYCRSNGLTAASTAISQSFQHVYLVAHSAN